MKLPLNKTKIICTIGPASESPEIIEQMINAGMNIARLNLSHGDFSYHAKTIGNIRNVARSAGKRIAIMADLPGPKMRIGKLAKEPLFLKPGDIFILTATDDISEINRVSVTFDRLPDVVKPNDILFLNDGIIQLEVEKVVDKDVYCKVIVGGELRSRKGLNLPGINLGISAFTNHDYDCLKFASEYGIDAVSQSFVERADDLEKVRNAAADIGYFPYVIAKIERSRALDKIDEILNAADGIMIARGDLGVEIPIEQIAIVQKKLTRKANLLGKPVITATQMLESMTNNRRPTRAEATDVANAIFDGTDCVMLSGESAMGSYPVDAVKMLAKIAVSTEPHLSRLELKESLKASSQETNMRLIDIISLSVENALEHVSAAAVFVPTRSGATARSIARFRLPVWVTAVSSQEKTCQRLLFSYGIYPVFEPEHPDNWNEYIRRWMKMHEVEGNLVILTEGPSSKHPEANNRMEIIDLTRKGSEKNEKIKGWYL